ARPTLMRAIEYWVIEPSARWRKTQKETLLEFAPRVRWFDSVERLPGSGARGIIFSNEFLDALPVHRLFWDAPVKRWFELGVGLAGEKFVWRKRSSAERASAEEKLPFFLPEVPREMLLVLPNGF